MTRDADADAVDRRQAGPWWAALVAELTPLLRQWIPGERWFPAKGTDDLDMVIDSLVELTDPAAPGEDQVIIATVLLAGTDSLRLQVPLVLRRDVGRPDRQGYIGTFTPPATGWAPRTTGSPAPPDRDWSVWDGAVDESYVTLWLAGWGRETATDTGEASTPETLRWHGDPPTETPMGAVRAVTGEQSNSSVIVSGERPVILKTYRVLRAGPNPDVIVPRRLAEHGWEHVARPLAWTTTSATAGDQIYTGVLSEYLDDAHDGFVLARERAASGRVVPASSLGRTIADLHHRLATLFPVGQQIPGSRLADETRIRAEWAMAAVPALAGRRADILARLGALANQPDRPTQRIHGDLHLGQVLWLDDGTADGRWVVLDFEGEPLRPLAERVAPGLPERDLAGVLRSFDYALATSGTTDRSWEAAARNAFLDGYAELVSEPGSTAVSIELIHALEIDKALYEAVYEYRNRPSWLSIPLTALDRLLAG